MEKENPVIWFEIYVTDMQRAQKFYETVLQTTLEEIQTPEGQDMQMLGFPGKWGSENAANGALVCMEGYKVGGHSTIVYFQSDDASIEETRVVAAGGKIHKTKTSIGDYGNMVLAEDTEGNMIGIHSMK